VIPVIGWVLPEPSPGSVCALAEPEDEVEGPADGNENGFEDCLEDSHAMKIESVAAGFQPATRVLAVARFGRLSYATEFQVLCFAFQSAPYRPLGSRDILNRHLDV